MRKRFTAYLMIATMLLGTSSIYANAIHTISNTQTITNGATLIKDQRLTKAGWQDVYVLKINLEDENIAIKPIGASQMNVKQTVSQMATGAGAIAAINADFFDTKSETPSFGVMVEDGQVVQAYNNQFVELGPRKNMGTLLVDDEHNILMDFFSVRLGIYSNGIKIGDANSYNKVSNYVLRPIVMDRKYMTNTQQVLVKYPETYTIVVENNQVIYQSQQGESVDIPKDGYVLMMDQVHAKTYYEKLPVGSNVEVESEIYLGNQLVDAIDAMEMGIGGGGLIMKDGAAYSGATHIIDKDKRHPRSAVATTHTKGELLLVGVDGRGNSIGATHQELIEILKSYGAKDAMYLDGGGSTTIVARQEGKHTVEVVNKPSDGNERKVINGIGVFTTSEVGAVDQLRTNLSKERSFIGEPIRMDVSAVDKNSNPVAINKEDIEFQVAGVEGKWVGNTFYPETAGEALLIAEVGGVQSAVEAYISKSPAGLVVEPSVVTINPKETKQVQVYGVDSGGYKIPLSADKLVWSNTSGIASATHNSITAGNTGTTRLTVKYNNADADVSVVVGDQVLRLESFEDNTPSWGGDTSHVKGTVQPSTEIKFHGNRSVKMTYTFEKTGNKQVAYTVLKNPIVLPSDASTFNMWVHGRKQGDTLKIEIVDAKGKTHYIKLAETIDFEGWKYLSTPLPSNIEMPAQVTKFYAYAHEVPEKRTTALYFDHASVGRGEREQAGIAVRDDYSFDSMYRATFQPLKAGEYSINVVGQTNAKSLKLSADSIKKMENQLSNSADKVVLASQNNAVMQLGDKASYYKNSYHESVHKDVQLVMLGTDQGGMRQTDSTQWNKLKQTLDNTKAKYIMLVMSKNPLTEFSDPREGKALHDYLVDYKEKTGKSIFILTPGGTEPEVRMEEGIRYMRTPGINGPTDNLEDGSFIQFKVTPNGVFYTFKPTVNK